MAEGSSSGDWRTKCEDVQERWLKARDIGFHTDAHFLVGKEASDAVTLSAHKLVLAFSSPVFDAMFFGSLAETKSPITITDIELEAFEIMIRYMYGENVEFTTIMQATKTYMAANKYLVMDLQATAEDYITREKLDDPTFWELVSSKEMIQIKMISRKCLEYMSDNAENLFKSYLFTNLSPEIVEDIVRLDKLNVLEFELLSAVVRWSMTNIQPNMSLKSKLEPFLYHIRFYHLTMEEYCSFLDYHPGLIDSDDALMIMKHLTYPAMYKLPQWCSVDKNKRYMKV